MAKRKTTKKRTSKKTVTRKKASPKKRAPRKKAVPQKVQSEPSYMVQVPEPKSIRKDVLETLRESIIFMQGYENFRAIQDEKVQLFTALKIQIKDLENAVSEVKKYFPQGKLRAVSREQQHKDNLAEEREDVEVVPIKPTPRVSVAPMPPPEPRNELAELEAQLKDIESQLQGIR